MSTTQTQHGKLELRDGDVELTVDQLGRTPLLAGALPATLKKLGSLRGRGAIVARRFSAGDVIVRQGDPGWTAFYVMRAADVRRIGLEDPDGVLETDKDMGASVSTHQLLLDPSKQQRQIADVFVSSAGRNTRRAKSGLLGRIGDLFYRRRHATVVDVEVPLTEQDDGTAVGHIREGELFGEASCFTHAPRSATIRATDDCWVIEVLRNVLEIVLENERFREALDEVYRRRVLDLDLAKVPLFDGAPPEAIATAREGAKLVRLQPGEAVFEAGAPADAVYFVRMGTVRLAREGQVQSYASRGAVLGLHAALAGGNYEATCTAYEPQREGARSSTTGVRVELVKIDELVIDMLRGSSPVVAANAERLTNAERMRDESAGSVDSLAGALGLGNGEKLLLIDLDRCTRCDDCVTACADSHDGVPRLVRDGPRFGRQLVAASCRQCTDPTCLIGCPVSSIHRGFDREIVIEDWCIGCGLCSEQCPYDAIAMTQFGASRKATTCDQCSSIGDGTPLCVYACGVDAARRIDGRTLFGGEQR